MLKSFAKVSIMNKFFISTLLVLALSMNVSAQRHPVPPRHPSRSEMIELKSRELEKRYNQEKKLILTHPLATKKMKRDQLRALDEKYRIERKLLRKM